MVGSLRQLRLDSVIEPASSRSRDLVVAMIAAATRREKRPLRGKHLIGLRVGRVPGRFKMGKHYQIHVEVDGFPYPRRDESIEREKKLDGVYVIRTNVPAESMPAAAVVRNYKQLSGVERAFRSLKTITTKPPPRLGVIPLSNPPSVTSRRAQSVD